MSEFDIIRRFFQRPQRAGILGVGDDCALLPAEPGAWAVSTDLLLEGRHFLKDADPKTLGHKALAVNLSDLAAMGAEPRGFVLGLALSEFDAAWLDAFTQGLYALADAYRCPLVGGDTTRSDSGLSIAVTVFGHVDARRALRRAGAKIGDDIWVSGALGDADLAVRLLHARTAPDHGEWSQEEVERAPFHENEVATEQQIRAWIAGLTAKQQQELLERTRPRLDLPEPRIALGRELSHFAHAAIDISDGLVQDLGHILGASHCGAVLFAHRLPLSAALKDIPRPVALRVALGGGDAYELCFTAPASLRTHVEELASRLELPLTRVGKIQPGSSVVVENACGQRLTGIPGGFDHFGEAGASVSLP